MHFRRTPWSGIAPLLALVAACVLPVVLASCSEDPGPQAGVISTGNAGRIRGTVFGGSDSSRAIEGASVFLQGSEGGTWSDLGSLLADSAGGFVFQDLSAGTYRVVARDALGNSGISAPFAVARGEEVRIVVVIVPVSRVRLAFVLSDGQSIRSVELEGTGLRAVPSGDAWILDVRPGTAGLVDVTVAKSGSTRVVRYALTWAAGEPVLSILDPGGPAVVPELADSAVLLADWDFAESDGILLDRSGRGNVGTAHGGVALVPGSTRWSFDGTSGYVTLGECILRAPGACADWTDGDVAIQVVMRLDTQTVAPVGHVLTLRSGNGEIMVKRMTGDTLGIGTASPEGFAGIGLPWSSRMGTWVDLVMVRDSTDDSMVVYLDGDRAGAFLAASPLHSSTGIPPALGAYTGGGVRYFARMVLDRVRIWSGRFDPAQVKALHQSI